MTRIATWLLLSALYLALTQNLAINNLVVAVLLGGLATLLVRPERGRSFSPAAAASAAWWSLRFLAFLIWDVIKCGVTVARIIIDPKLPIRQGIIVVKSGSPNETVTVLSAHGITITPGEQVVGFGEDGAMAVHCLDAVSSGAGADAAQANRRNMLERIFGGAA
jgi:multicomponent Na+:H+ antiporter subunit E